MTNSVLENTNHLRYRGSARRAHLWLMLFACLQLGTAGAADNPSADPNSVLAQAELITRITAESQASKAEAVQWAQQYGYPIRYEDGQRVLELMAVWKDRPVYYVTDNANAAISTATDRIRDTVSWNLDANGVIVGLWDESAVRVTHREFRTPDGQSRVRLGEGGAIKAHTTHVAGTIGAAGVNPAAKGMAPAASIQSFNWNYDASKMALWTANGSAQPDRIYVSNHSYGFLSGWFYASDEGFSGHVGWHWRASWAGPKSYDELFGMYHSLPQQWDEVVFSKGYYLPFAAAGNDRTDNPPMGETVYYWATNAWQSITYDLNTCPPGDGIAKGGYGTVCGPAVAKNIMTVGAVGDAMARGARSLAHTRMASFSSWGPTNDGRIKPDIVANGVGVYSTWSRSDDSYATTSGTSMAAPNAAGSAALLTQLYRRLFSGKSMEASTLKGLIIHTADDLGRPGPDYQFGWGLLNARAAAELIQRKHDEPVGKMIAEKVLNSSNPSDLYYFYSDGTEPIRVTLCWADPAWVDRYGFAKMKPQVLQDLNLRVLGPVGLVRFYPYVLDAKKPDAIATTGDNTCDNVQQVYIGTPGVAGWYKVQIDYNGSLQNGGQFYSLISSVPLLDQSWPTATDVSVYGQMNAPVTITLKATDDGLPSPPGKLIYTIASLAQHGSLTSMTGTPIAASDKLPNYGNQVIYTPAAGYAGDDSFGFYAEDGATYPQGGSSNTATVTVQVRNLVTVEYQVGAPADDGYASIWGGYQMLSGATLLVGQYTAGMRFTNVAIPPGSQIVSVRLEVCREADQVDQRFAGVLRAEATGNAASFAEAGRYINDLPRTQASVSWVWDTSTHYSRSTYGDEQPTLAYWYTSPDLSPVVQEVVARADWSQGNAIAILFGSDGASTCNLSLYSCEQSASRAAKLTITYTPPEREEPKSVPPVEPGRTPPVAADVGMYVTANTPALITLAATDDNLPGPVHFTICSLPGHGSLQYLDETLITKPVTLAGVDSQVVYQPGQGFSGDDSFTVYADDGGDAPTGGKSNTATITLKVRHMVTREYEVIAQEDDAYGTDANTVVASETLSVGRHSSAMWFRNIDLPRESEIISARLKLCMDTTSIDGLVEATLYAQAVGDANDFNQPDLRIPALPATRASVPWNWAARQTCPRETYCSSPELRTIIQEIVDRDDWSAGNCMTLLYAGDASNSRDVQFFACDTPYSNRAAKLEITYTLKPGAEWSVLGYPPDAEDIPVEVSVNRSVMIALNASDDGMPYPPGRLTYTIASLPNHGKLGYPDGSQIAAPGPLAKFGKQVIYRPEPNFLGEDSFTFYADDGGIAPRGGKSNTATVQISVLEEATLEYQVASGVDDGYGNEFSSYQVTNAKSLSIGVQISGIRFRSVQVPQGVAIMDARLKVCSYTDGLTAPVVGYIEAEATDDAADFSGRRISSAHRTNAIEWDLTPAAWKPNTWYESTDISKAIQEVVDRPGWVPGNAMAIICWGNTFVGDRTVWAYDGDPSQAPRLVITYRLKK